MNYYRRDYFVSRQLQSLRRAQQTANNENVKISKGGEKGKRKKNTKLRKL